MSETEAKRVSMHKDCLKTHGVHAHDAHTCLYDVAFRNICTKPPDIAITLGLPLLPCAQIISNASPMLCNYTKPPRSQRKLTNPDKILKISTH